MSVLYKPKALKMKTLATIAAKFAFLLAIALLVLNTAMAQTTKKERQAKKAAEVQQLINGKAYVFKASYVTPLRGPGHALTSDYDMTVNKDSLVSYLPYFGRAFVAPADPTKNPFEFTSTKFEYSAVVQKNGGWEIAIATKDNRDIEKMYLSISADGYATLHVTPYNQDAIAYDGYIEAMPKKKG